MKYLRYFVVAFLATVCVNMMAVDITVDLALAKNATPNPPYGTIIGDGYSAGSFDGTGYKIGSDGKGIGWEISGSPYTITAITFEGYINTNNTSKNWGFAFSSDGGQTWGSEVTQANDGTKSFHTITVSATIPAGTNAFKIIRRAGTTTYVRRITYTVAAACDGPTFTQHPATADATYKVGNTATALTVAASGTGVTYQWYSNSTASNTGGTAISGATNASYTPSTTGIGTTYYYCEAKASDCAITTASNVSGAITVQAKSVDNSLSDLKVNGSTIAGFAPTKTNYNITLPQGSGQPTVVPTAADAAATLGAVTITNPTANTYVATFTVTAEDGSPANYTIEFIVDDGNPRITSFVVSGVTATIDQTAHTITAELPYGSSLTGLTPTVQIANATSYSPTGAQDFTNPVVYTVGSINYTVTLTVSELSTDATLSSLTVSGQSISFSPTTLTYNVELSAGSSVPTVTYTTNHPSATAVKTDATAVPGVTKIVVTAQDRTTTKTYTINFNIIVPPSGLTTHVPGLYEEQAQYGGYDQPLVIYPKTGTSREFEVYYAGRAASNSLMAIRTSPGDKMTGIEDQATTTSTSCRMADGWGAFTTASTSSGTFAAIDEFDSPTDVFKTDGNTLKIDIQGFDQFSYYGADKNVEIRDGAFRKNQRFQVFIDGVMQPETQCSTDATVRRYDISTGHHVIEVKALPDGQSLFYGFSLRVGTDPRVKHLKGNDSTQVVYQTNAIRKILYYTKYNQTTELEWVGNTGTGINLTVGGNTDIGDTIIMSGNANCPVGKYNYRVVAKKDGIETSAVTGKFEVLSKIEYDALHGGELEQQCDLNMSMDEIRFRAYAIDAEQVSISWPNGTPTGVTTRFATEGDGNYYYISGTPTFIGEYPFIVTVGTTSISGNLNVMERNYTNSVMYLVKNVNHYKDKAAGCSSGYDSIYDYLLGVKNMNVIARRAKPTGVRTASEYAKYQKMVIISEDVDATDKEAIEIARGGVVNLPVLNMKGFTYTSSRLGWGYPNNGSLTQDSITINEPSHPIFSSKSGKQKVLREIKTRGLMPIEVTLQGSMCLATAPIRSEDYVTDGTMQTIIHEVPAADHGGQKYIAFPVGRESKLSAYGKTLLDNIISYLTGGATSPVRIPDLEITSFTLEGMAATIDQNNNEIRMELRLPDGADPMALLPVVTVKDTKKTWWESQRSKTTYDDNGNVVSIDMRDKYNGVEFYVREYINVRTYKAYINILTGLDEVYSEGEWVNIYDMMGRKVATTNENIYTMELPRGMYIIQTAKGSFKIFK